MSFYDPREQGVEYQLDEEKLMFDSTTVEYYQTYLNTPVWRRGLSVTIKAARPNRVRLLNGTFFIYKYDPKKRFAAKPAPTVTVRRRNYSTA